MFAVTKAICYEIQRRYHIFDIAGCLIMAYAMLQFVGLYYIWG